MALVISAALTAATVSCSSGGGGGTTATGSGGGGTTGTGGSGTTSAGTSSSTAQSTGVGGAGGGAACGPQCSGKLACAANSEFCSADAELVKCGLASPQDTVHACGVPLGSSGEQLARSSGVKEFGGSGPPQTGCFAPAGYPAKPGASQTVTMSGVARVFMHGCESKSLKIEVYTVKHAGGSEEGNLDQLVGAAVTTPSSCKASGMDSDCGTIYECQYTYAGVPTETELVIKTSGSLWTPMYEYNVYLQNGAVNNGTSTRDVQALSTDDYYVTAQAALGGPISSGNGLILGEVHDCGDVRLVQATVDIDQPKKLLSYFTSNEQSPLPDLSASATTALGRYAAFDVAPGPVVVAATGLDAGSTTMLGFTRAHVFPDSVSLVTFHGLLPSQVP